jgi:hypothetical protein
MKKFLAAILLLVYMTASSGVAMEIHYCMGKKAGVEFYGSSTDKCGICGMKEKKGCCHDEHRFAKLEDSHKNVSNDISFNAGETAILTEYALYNWQLEADDASPIVNNHSPPADTGPSACIMNCVFRL